MELRKRGLGGSDVSAILKQSPFATPLDVYYDKLGLSQPIEETDRMRAGKYLEPAVAEMFKDAHPEMDVRIDNYMRFHKKHKFMYANTDRIMQDENGKKGVLEIKCTNSWYAKTWTESIPYNFYVQAQHYLGVLGLDFCYIAVLIDGYKYDDYLLRS